MWDTLKSLWMGRAPRLPTEDVLPPEAAAGAASPEGATAEQANPTAATPGKAQAARPSAPSIGDELVAIDGAVQRGDLGAALVAVRELLVRFPARSDVLHRAAAVLSVAGEAELAQLFNEAKGSPDGHALLTLAYRFLQMRDPTTALAMARGARQRSGDVPEIVALTAEALARSGEHEAVVERLERFEGSWPTQDLLARYARSAILAGDRGRFERVAIAAESLSEYGPELAAAGRRAAANDVDADGSPLRWCLHILHGAALLDHDEMLDNEVVGPARIARIAGRAAAFVAATPVVPDRIVYATRRGEVLARWLAQALDATAMPLSARIPNQPVVAVAVDDEDLFALLAEPAIDGGGEVRLFQLVKDPSLGGLPVADMYGVLGVDLTLPLDELEGDRAAERVPPSVLAAELRKAAGEPVDAELDSWAAWVLERQGDLTFVTPPALHGRHVFGADLPRWALSPSVAPAEPAPVPAAAAPVEQAEVVTTVAAGAIATSGLSKNE